MRFGLVANINRAGADQSVKQMVQWAKKCGHEITLSSDLKGIANDGAKSVPLNELSNQIDILVSMGGDGTLLASARAVGDTGVPILGINIGSLGFLTQQPATELISSLEAVVAGKYKLDERLVLDVEVAGAKSGHAAVLNEAVLNNGPISRLIDIDLYANGEHIVTYRADGLIIATPTGSTAYSLAAGGPIVHPRMEAIIASPISSFSLNTRPMVFSADDLIELEAGESAQSPTLALDGQVMMPLKARQRVTIKRADYRVKLIAFPGSSYYKLLRNKLHWGISPVIADTSDKRQ